MASLFTSGSIIRCVNSCSVVEVIDNQRLLPHMGRVPWVVFLEPGEVSLVLDMALCEALLLIGNKVFAFDRQNRPMQDCFEVLNATQ